MALQKGGRGADGLSQQFYNHDHPSILDWNLLLSTIRYLLLRDARSISGKRVHFRDASHSLTHSLVDDRMMMRLQSPFLRSRGQKKTDQFRKGIHVDARARRHRSNSGYIYLRRSTQVYKWHILTVVLDIFSSVDWKATKVTG